MGMSRFWVLCTWVISRPLTAPAPALEVMHHSMLAFYQETAYTMIYIAKNYSISKYVGPGAIWAAK